jgi:hypothetical protein
MTKHLGRPESVEQLADRQRRFERLAAGTICRKLGFALVEECAFEYPPGSFIRCNDWRIDLFAGS